MKEGGSVVWFPAGLRDFSLLRNVQSSPGALWAFYIIGTGGGGFPEDKASRSQTNHWPSCSSAVRNVWSCTSTPTYSLTVCPQGELPLILILYKVLKFLLLFWPFLVFMVISTIINSEFSAVRNFIVVLA